MKINIGQWSTMTWVKVVGGFFWFSALLYAFTGITLWAQTEGNNVRELVIFMVHVLAMFISLVTVITDYLNKQREANHRW